MANINKQVNYEHFNRIQLFTGQLNILIYGVYI